MSFAQGGISPQRALTSARGLSPEPLTTAGTSTVGATLYIGGQFSAGPS